jgi:hypothetical protein
MDNIERVTSFLREKIIKNGGDPERETMTVIKTADGQNVYKYDDDNVFRVYTFVPDTITIEDGNKDDLFNAGEGFGHFQKMLSDFPVDTLYETIVDFHNTPKRVEALKAAIAALALKPVVPGLDYTELDKQLADAKTYEGKEDKYTTDSWDAFVKAWEAGKKAREEATTQKELDDAAKALKDAIAALKEKPTTPAETKLDYTELEKLIKKAGKLKEKRYTPESWANMLQVLADAKALICNAETQEEIDAMVDSLAAAIDALVPVDKSPSTEGVVMLLPLFLIIAALVVLFVYASKRKTDKATSK